MNSAAARAFAVFALLASLVFGVVTFGGYQVIVQSRSSTHYNGTILKILLSVSGCTTADTPDACSQRQAARAAAQGDERVDAVVCRVRLALAGRPVPAAGAPCAVP